MNQSFIFLIPLDGRNGGAPFPINTSQSLINFLNSNNNIIVVRYFVKSMPGIMFGKTTVSFENNCTLMLSKIIEL